MLSKERMIEIAESCGLGPNIAVEYGTSLMEALRAQADAQPMYGSDMKAIAQRNLVSFLTKASFASNVDREAAMNCVEVLASHPAPEAAKPVAWVRFTSDGGYEGPIMDCDRRIDDVRRKSGAWTPLFTRAPEAAQAGLTLDAGEIAFLAARLRRLFEREQYTLPEFARENDSALIGIAGSVIGAILTRASAATVAEPSTDRLAYEGAREDLLDWKRRALAAEELNRKFMDSINGPTHMGEPVIAAQQQAEPVGDERAAFLNRMEVLDLKEFRELTGCQSPAEYRIKLEDLHGDGESLAAEYLQDKVFEDMRLMYKAMGEFDNKAVDHFAKAMKRKMATSRKKGRSGWDDPKKCPPERLAQMLIDHLEKGDPVDVGNFSMMLFNRPDAVGVLARVVAQSGQRAGVAEDARDAARYRAIRACGKEWSGLRVFDARGDIVPEALDEEADGLLAAAPTPAAQGGDSHD